MYKRHVQNKGEITDGYGKNLGVIKTIPSEKLNI